MDNPAFAKSNIKFTLARAVSSTMEGAAASFLTPFLLPTKVGLFLRKVVKII